MHERNHSNNILWKHSSIGGGGYITGILQNPSETDIMYARCDVAGVFKSQDRGKSWYCINNGMSECHHHSVQSFTLSSSNPQILFRCSGDARGGKTFGSIHKSRDGGESWYRVCDEVDYYGNGPTRMFGEVIAVSPHNAEVVVTGGYSKGTWSSSDEGETWSYSGLEGERIGCIAFHPFINNVVYAGTISDRGIDGGDISEKELEAFLSTLGDYPRMKPGRLYLSKDNGKSWSLLFEGCDFAELAFDKEDRNHLYAACIDNGIMKSTDGGKSWSSSGNGLLEAVRYGNITSDYQNPAVLYTAPDIRPNHTHAVPICIFKSLDKGEHWEQIKEHSFSDLKGYPSYTKSVSEAGWAISKVRVDTVRPATLYVSNWHGVTVSEDGGNTFNANGFTGTETTCCENVKVSSFADGKIYMTLCDHSVMVSEDNGKTYRPTNRIQGYNASSAVVSSRFKPGTVIYGVINRGAKKACMVRSDDYGKNTDTVWRLKEGLFIQALAEDYFVPGRFYAYVDGDMSRGAGIYSSEDWGFTWEKLNLRFPGHIKTLPHRKHWIEAELLSVVVYQVKNGCGTNQLLCTDPHEEDRIYFGEWTEGLYMVSHGGSKLENIGAGLPFGRTEASVLSCIKVDEKRRGVIYAGFIREGLWRTEDYGNSWYKVFPKEDIVFNATSIALGGKDSEELYVACEPLYWSKAEASIYFSQDWGNHWTNIYNKELGAVRWKSIDVDDGGNIYAVSCGNGSFYAKKKD